MESAQPHLDAAAVATNWESSLLQLNAAVAIEHLGDMKRLRDFGNSNATAAKRSGDLAAYVAAVNDYGLAFAAANDLEGLAGAIEESNRVIRSWTAGYGVWHCTIWRLKVLLALRRGDGDEASELYEAEWPLIVDALLLETRALRCLALECKAAVVLSSRSRERRGRRWWLRAARSLTRAIAQTDRTDAKPLAELLRAAAAYVQGDTRQASSRLSSAADLFDAAAMSERACLTRWRIAALAGDDGARQEQEMIAADLGVEDLAGWARFRTPGFD